MAEFLPFWPKAGIGAYMANGGGTAVIYSRALPTNGFTEVVVQMQVDATFGGAGGPAYTSIDVDPQISNDGVYWETLTASGLSIWNNDTFPANEIEKFMEIAAFMRMKITIINQEAATGLIAATLSVSGVGRS